MAKSSPLFKVSQSKVKTWRKCRQAYAYKYVDGLRRKVVSRPLKFGTIVHQMLEAWAKKEDPFKLLDKINLKDKKLFQSEREAYGNIISDIRTIMTEYFLFHKNDGLEVIPLKKERAEHIFELPLTNRILFKGKIDLFAETGNGLRWLVEHKTFGRMPSEDHRWRNIQSSVYLWAGEKLGVKLDGTMWDYIGSKPPNVPEQLKNGDTSIRAAESLPTTIINTLKERGQLKDKKYAGLIKKAEGDRKKWFQRIHSRKRPAVIKQMMDDFTESAMEMEEIGMKSRVRTIDRHCDWCEFEPLCRATLQGLDVKFTMDREYYHEEDEFDYYNKGDEET